MVDVSPRFSPEMELSLKAFLTHANYSGLHPLDWDRFYQFIIHAHTGNLRMVGYEVKQLLLQEGFPENVAYGASEAYDHGRGVLKEFARMHSG
jgi:hypothetical protein